MFNAPWATSSPSPTSPQFLSPPGQFGPSRYGRLQTSSERYHLNESPTAYVGQLPTQDYTDDSAGVRGILVTGVDERQYEVVESDFVLNDNRETRHFSETTSQETHHPWVERATVPQYDPPPVLPSIPSSPHDHLPSNVWSPPPLGPNQLNPTARDVHFPAITAHLAPIPYFGQLDRFPHSPAPLPRMRLADRAPPPAPFLLSHSYPLPPPPPMSPLSCRPSSSGHKRDAHLKFLPSINPTPFIPSPILDHPTPSSAPQELDHQRLPSFDFLSASLPDDRAMTSREDLGPTSSEEWPFPPFPIDTRVPTPVPWERIEMEQTRDDNKGEADSKRGRDGEQRMAGEGEREGGVVEGASGRFKSASMDVKEKGKKAVFSALKTEDDAQLARTLEIQDLPRRLTRNAAKRTSNKVDDPISVGRATSTVWAGPQDDQASTPHAADTSRVEDKDDTLSLSSLDDSDGESDPETFSTTSRKRKQKAPVKRTSTPKKQRRATSASAQPLSSEAILAFSTWYDTHRTAPYPSPEQKLEWMTTFPVSRTQVDDWFNNKRRRAKMREGGG